MWWYPSGRTSRTGPAGWADLGIGVAHDDPAPSTESLSAALKTALTTETGARATAVAGLIHTDGATVAAKMLLEVVNRGRPSMSA
jgi:vancomycin aglycone glucosyltransferase